MVRGPPKSAQTKKMLYNRIGTSQNDTFLKLYPTRLSDSRMYSGIMTFYLDTLARQHVIDKEVWVELGSHDKLVATGGELGCLDGKVFKVDRLDLGILLSVDLRECHIALISVNQ